MGHKHLLPLSLSVKLLPMLLVWVGVPMRYAITCTAVVVGASLVRKYIFCRRQEYSIPWDEHAAHIRSTPPATM